MFYVLQLGVHVVAEFMYLGRFNTKYMYVIRDLKNTSKTAPSFPSQLLIPKISHYSHSIDGLSQPTKRRSNTPTTTRNKNKTNPITDQNPPNRILTPPTPSPPIPPKYEADDQEKLAKRIYGRQDVEGLHALIQVCGLSSIQRV